MFLCCAGQVLNIYAQVGLIMLIGLAGGNAILIVDLANQKMGEGGSALEAAKFSAKSRLRPFLMMAISSLTGFLPLMLASGGGAQSKSSLGLVVFGGLLVATFLSTLVVPVFYVVMSRCWVRLMPRLRMRCPPQPRSRVDVWTEALAQSAQALQ